MKKWFWILTVVVLAADLTGCATVQKKFTRKKKEPKHIAQAIYFEKEPFQKKYSNAYYYKTHFTFWKTWQDELINYLGGNRKKVERCAQEAVGHLNEMSAYLVPEKQAELKAPLEEMTQIAAKIESGQFSQYEEGSMRVDLERLKRVISNQFYYDRVKDSILPDAVDLGAAEAPAATTTAVSQPAEKPAAPAVT